MFTDQLTNKTRRTKMINFLSNAWSDFVDWKEETSEKAAEWLNHKWDYYTKDRAVIHGFPIAVLSSIAATFLFNCTKRSTAAIFGAVSYLTLTSLLEIIRAHHYVDKTKACIIVGVSSAVTLGFIKTVCKTSMTYQAAIILSIASFSGQLAREFFIDKNS
jgi:hypothetical protein